MRCLCLFFGRVCLLFLFVGFCVCVCVVSVVVCVFLFVFFYTDEFGLHFAYLCAFKKLELLFGFGIFVVVYKVYVVYKVSASRFAIFILRQAMQHMIE